MSKSFQLFLLWFCSALLRASLLCTQPLNSLSENKIDMLFSRFEKPSIEEWFFLQDYLSSRDLSTYPRSYRYRKFTIITPSFFPSRHYRVHGEDSKSYREKQRCIVNYISFQSRYIRWSKRLIRGLERVGYVGDSLFLKGGWPNIEGGDLPFILKSYGFKIAIIREAKRLGHRFVVWLDSSMIPIGSLEPLFKHLEKNQFVFHTSPRTFKYFCTDEFKEALQVTDREVETVELCRTGVFGIDLESELGRQFLDLWYEYSLIDGASQTEAPEAMIVSLILHRLNCYKGRVFQNLFLEGDDVNQDYSLFFLKKQ